MLQRNFEAATATFSGPITGNRTNQEEAKEWMSDQEEEPSCSPTVLQSTEPEQEQQQAMTPALPSSRGVRLGVLVNRQFHLASQSTGHKTRKTPVLEEEEKKPKGNKRIPDMWPTWNRIPAPTGEEKEVVMEETKEPKCRNLLEMFKEQNK